MDLRTDLSPHRHGVSVAAGRAVTAVTWAARSSLGSLWGAVRGLAMAPAVMALVSAFRLMARSRATADRRFRASAPPGRPGPGVASDR